jgi:nucleoside-diphosphate-sugar epimerase
MIISKLEENELLFYADKLPWLSSFANKTILVTGASGMIGSGLIHLLLVGSKLQHFSVKIIFSTRHPDKKPVWFENGDSVTFVKYLDEENSLSGVAVDYVIHCASPTSSRFFVEHPVETFSDIVDGTKTMLAFAKSKDATFCYISTLEVYGSPNVAKPVKEKYIGRIDNLLPRSSYPLGKKSAEFLTSSYNHEFGLRSLIIRLSSTQGLYQNLDDERVCNQILKCVLFKKNFEMLNRGAKKSILYTLDACSGILVALLKGKYCEAYNISCEENFMLIEDIAKLVFDKYDKSLSVTRKNEKGDSSFYLNALPFVQDSSKIRKLGWMPFSSVLHIYDVDVSRFSSVASR